MKHTPEQLQESGGKNSVKPRKYKRQICCLRMFVVVLTITTLVGIGVIIYLAVSKLSEPTPVPEKQYTACDIFCRGHLLHVIQTARLFNDSKEFVDMPLKKSPKDVLTEFDHLPNYSKENLLQFLSNNFLPAGSDIEEITPTDFKIRPDTLVKALERSKYLEWSLALNSIWKSLVRKPKVVDPTRTTLLPWKNPVVVPGGRFRESYYWDSYWIILGLIECEMIETAKGVVSNFIDVIEDHGHIPNGGRAYYLTRSHPPLLAEMVSELNATGALSTDYLKRALQALEKEYDFFMNKDRTVLVNKHLLNRYTGGGDRTPRPESYREDIETSAASAAKGYPTDDVLIDLRAGAESGWDYSTRWFRRGALTIDEIDTRNVLPVDLNVLLLKQERFLETTFKELGNEEKSSKYKRHANEREAAIDGVLWDEGSAMWRDWLVKEGKSSSVMTVSNFFPLWAGLGATGNRKQRILASLKQSRLVRAGGVATTSVDSGQQWDGDNGWPPLQDMLIEGLLQGGDAEGKAMAIEIVKNWLEGNFIAWKKNSAMYEKYAVSKPGVGGGGGEYQVQLGFGWTNGLALKLLVKFAEYIN